MGKKITYHSYFGGKTKFESFINPVIPQNFKTYLEPFSGSFAVYFLINLPDSCKNIIYNDINKDQVNLFECSRTYDKFRKILINSLEDGLLYCPEKSFEKKKEFYKKMYYDLKKSNFRNDDFIIPDYNRATLYSFLLTSAFSSCSYTAAGFSGFNKERMKLQSLIKKLDNPYIQEMFSKITSVENLDFETIINKYDSDDTFIYLDPPYASFDDKGVDSGKRSGWYGTSDVFDKECHVKLLKILQNTKSRWALSYYYFEQLEQFLPKDKYFWREKEFFRSSASFSETKSQKGKELLITNYNPSEFTDKSVKEPKVIKIPTNKPISDSFWDE